MEKPGRRDVDILGWLGGGGGVVVVVGGGCVRAELWSGLVWRDQTTGQSLGLGMGHSYIKGFISHNSARNGRSRESESARKTLLAWF